MASVWKTSRTAAKIFVSVHTHFPQDMETRQTIKPRYKTAALQPQIALPKNNKNKQNILKHFVSPPFSAVHFSVEVRKSHVLLWKAPFSQLCQPRVHPHCPMKQKKDTKYYLLQGSRYIPKTPTWTLDFPRSVAVSSTLLATTSLCLNR